MTGIWQRKPKNASMMSIRQKMKMEKEIRKYNHSQTYLKTPPTYNATKIQQRKSEGEEEPTILSSWRTLMGCHKKTYWILIWIDGPEGSILKNQIIFNNNIATTAISSRWTITCLGVRTIYAGSISALRVCENVCPVWGLSMTFKKWKLMA